MFCLADKSVSVPSTALCVHLHALPAEVFEKLPHELYMRQPMRTSRVAEAALRTIQQDQSGGLDVFGGMVALLSSIHEAAEATSPKGMAPTTNLLLNRRLTMRSCSQLVTTLKAISRPLPVDPQREGPAEVFIFKAQVASGVAMVGPTVHSWAVGARQEARRLGCWVFGVVGGHWQQGWGCGCCFVQSTGGAAHAQLMTTRECCITAFQQTSSCKPATAC